MKKHLKYLISFFLVFGLAVNDCSVYAPSHSAAYYQFSNVSISKELKQNRSRVCVFNLPKSAASPSFPILISYQQLQDPYNLATPVLIKKQTLLFQKISYFTAEHRFLKEITTSKNALATLYIA